jgi:hypothetical protein
VDESVLSRLCESAGAPSIAPLPAARAIDGDSIGPHGPGASPVSPSRKIQTGSDGPEEIGFRSDPVDGPVTNFVSPVPTEGWDSDQFAAKSSSKTDRSMDRTGSEASLLAADRCELDRRPKKIGCTPVSRRSRAGPRPSSTVRYQDRMEGGMADRSPARSKGFREVVS